MGVENFRTHTNKENRGALMDLSSLARQMCNENLIVHDQPKSEGRKLNLLLELTSAVTPCGAMSMRALMVHANSCNKVNIQFFWTNAP